MPRVTRFTDMNEYANASNPDQPFTRPVAFRRNSAGAFATSPVVIDPSLLRFVDLRSAVDQQVLLHLAFLRVQVDDRRLEDPVLVGAAGVDGQRATDLHRPPAFVDVTVE